MPATLMARRVSRGPQKTARDTEDLLLTWAFVERVTRIELALSAWEVERLGLPEALTWRLPGSRVTVVDPLLPRLMAR
jgi:hypothetical protein